MSQEGDQQGGATAGGHGQVEFSWEKLSEATFLVKVRIGGKLIHTHAFDLNSATARASFATALAQKLASRSQLSISLKDVEERLLRFIEEADPGPADYQVVSGADDPEKDGIYLRTPRGPIQASNFAMHIDHDVVVLDGGERRRVFNGRIILRGVTTAFSISSEEYASGSRLRAAIFRLAGAKARVLCSPEVLVRAVSAVSRPIEQSITRDFGWTEEGDAYLAKSVRIDASGIHPVGSADPLRVDLGDEKARHLDLMALSAEELAEIKTHIVVDLLRLNLRRVTFLLLSAAALAVLVRFSRGMNRPAIWLTGLTGGGKSFLGRLFANFFGDFPVADGGRHGSWTSTSNCLQTEGYFYKDAIYMIDDYKPDLIPRREVVEILQNYADNSARGRLRADATTNVSRPIRGVLISTGEDVPERSASSVARTVVVGVPQSPKDIPRGRRCMANSVRYRAVMAAFIHHLIVNGRTAAFAERVEAELDFFYQGIAGDENDSRIAGNFALLMASFQEFAAFLGDAWPDRQRESEAFRADLVAVRDEMLAGFGKQQASEVFLSALKVLVMSGQVQITKWHPQDGMGGNCECKLVVGKVAGPRPGRPVAFDIATTLALAEVQNLLRRQGKTPLAVTEKALIQQLVRDGKLLDRDNRPIPPETGGDHTWAAKVAGVTRNVFRIRADELIGESTTAIPNPGGGPGTYPGGPPVEGAP
jgi:hypothetical protein